MLVSLVQMQKMPAVGTPEYNLKTKQITLDEDIKLKFLQVCGNCNNLKDIKNNYVSLISTNQVGIYKKYINLSNWNILNNFLDYERKTNNLTDNLKIGVHLFCSSGTVSVNNVNDLLKAISSLLKEKGLLLKETMWQYKLIKLQDDVEIYESHAKNEEANIFLLQAKKLDVSYLDHLIKREDFFNTTN